MSEIPEAMMTRERDPDRLFTPNERLFRRFPPIYADGTRVEMDAIALPDMSVNREKYGPPKWLLLDDDFEGWGVFAFEVADIPDGFLVEGVRMYSFKPVHCPQKRNYPHSEVRAYENGEHISSGSPERLPRDVQLRFRERLRWGVRVCIQPKS